MRRQDIKPGTVYAYQRSENHSPVPVVILSTQLYTGGGRYHRGPLEVREAEPGSRPGTNYLGAATGYPAVFHDGMVTGIEDIPQLLSAATLEHIPRGAKLSIVTTLTCIKGEYAPVLAAFDQERAAERQRGEEAARRRHERAERGRRVVAVLADRGISAMWAGHVELPLEQAEKLLAIWDAS